MVVDQDIITNLLVKRVDIAISFTLNSFWKFTDYELFEFALKTVCSVRSTRYLQQQGAFVWDQSGIRIVGIMRVSVCLGAILIPEYRDFHSSYSAPRSRIAGINSGINSYSGIFQTNAPLVVNLRIP